MSSPQVGGRWVSKPAHLDARSLADYPRGRHAAHLLREHARHRGASNAERFSVLLLPRRHHLAELLVHPRQVLLDGRAELLLLRAGKGATADEPRRQGSSQPTNQAVRGIRAARDARQGEATCQASADEAGLEYNGTHLQQPACSPRALGEEPVRVALGGAHLVALGQDGFPLG